MLLLLPFIADVDQNEVDSDAAKAADAAAIAAVQADVDQNESDADAAIAAVQADVDQNESDADAAIADSLLSPILTKMNQMLMPLLLPFRLMLTKMK